MRKFLGVSLMVLICPAVGVSGGTADAHGSGPCTRKGVGVQIPSRAPTKALTQVSISALV